VDTKQPTENRRQKSFLWTLVFAKPGSLLWNPNELRKAGIGQSLAKDVVMYSFIAASLFAGLIAYLILAHTQLAEGPSGPWPYIMITLVVWYLFRYLLAKWLLSFYKSQKGRSLAP